MGARKGSLYFREKFLSPIGGVANDEQQNSDTDGGYRLNLRECPGDAYCGRNWFVLA